MMEAELLMDMDILVDKILKEHGFNTENGNSSYGVDYKHNTLKIIYWSEKE